MLKHGLVGSLALLFVACGGANSEPSSPPPASELGPAAAGTPPAQPARAAPQQKHSAAEIVKARGKFLRVCNQPESKPRAKAAISESEIEVGEIKFVMNSASIVPNYFDRIELVAAALEKDLEIELLEVTAAGGKPRTLANGTLTQRRAEAVMTALIVKGVAPKRLRAVGLEALCPDSGSGGKAGGESLHFRVVKRAKKPPVADSCTQQAQRSVKFPSPGQLGSLVSVLGKDPAAALSEGKLLEKAACGLDFGSTQAAPKVTHASAQPAIKRQNKAYQLATIPVRLAEVCAEKPKALGRLAALHDAARAYVTLSAGAAAGSDERQRAAQLALNLLQIQKEEGMPSGKHGATTELWIDALDAGALYDEALAMTQDTKFTNRLLFHKYLDGGRKDAALRERLKTQGGLVASVAFQDAGDAGAANDAAVDALLDPGAAFGPSCAQLQLLPEEVTGKPNP